MLLHSETYIYFCETERSGLAHRKCSDEEMCKIDMVGFCCHGENAKEKKKTTTFMCQYEAELVCSQKVHIQLPSPDEECPSVY